MPNCALVVSVESGKGPMSRHYAQRLTTERSKAGWLAVGAVQGEPFSAANSLLTGKLTENFGDSGLPKSRFEQNKRRFTLLWCGTDRFGNRELFHRNREFLEANRELFGVGSATPAEAFQWPRDRCN
jgi:hypothetical protein